MAPQRQTSIDNVHPLLQKWWAELNRLWSIYQPDLEIRVHESLRSAERQAWLYAQGRTTPGPKVTWLEHSPHQDGLAIDIYIYCRGKWISGSTPQELAVYRHLAMLGQGKANEVIDGCRVFNLGRRTGKDWYHFELEPRP